MCLAVTKLLEMNQPIILLSLQSLMTIWTDVLTELQEGVEDARNPHRDSLVYDTSSGAAADPHESPEDSRRKRMTWRDEIHTISLPEWVRKHLQQTIAATGDSFEQEWLVNVDKEVVSGFGQLGVM